MNLFRKPRLLLALLILANYDPFQGEVHAAGNAPACEADLESATWVVERFFDRDGFPERAKYYTGEMSPTARQPTIGAGLPDGVGLSHRLVVVNCPRAAYATTLSVDTRGGDWYLYLLHQDGTWKIEAVRTLFLPGFFHSLLEYLVANRDRLDEVDRESAAALAAARTALPNVAGLEEEIEPAADMLARMLLAVSTDAQLRQYFIDNEEAFRRLAAEVGRYPSLRQVTNSGRMEPKVEAARPLVGQMRQLGIRVITPAARPGCTFFGIAGVADNEVGYLYAAPGCTVPEISPGPFIYVEQVAPDWFLYKTT